VHSEPIMKGLRKCATPTALTRFTDKELHALAAELKAKADRLRKIEEGLLMTYGIRRVADFDKRHDLVTAVLIQRAVDETERHYSREEGALLVRETRELLGLTQKELAARLGVDPNTVARWERAESGVKRSMFKLIHRIADEAKARPRE
jgi:DNA-binding transcriptional regulator YiaG